jgi:hypothetical protein
MTYLKLLRLFNQIQSYWNELSSLNKKIYRIGDVLEIFTSFFYNFIVRFCIHTFFDEMTLRVLKHIMWEIIWKWLQWENKKIYMKKFSNKIRCLKYILYNIFCQKTHFKWHFENLIAKIEIKLHRKRSSA